MIISFKTGFEKKTARLPRNVAGAFANRLRLFNEQPYHPLLKNHSLKGDQRGYRSINITGDWRAIYEPIGEDTVRFVDIGTHHDLYGS